MKTSSLGYGIFFGTLVIAVAAQTPILFIIGFVLGTVLVVVGEVKEGNKGLVITAIIMALATGLAALLAK